MPVTVLLCWMDGDRGFAEGQAGDGVVFGRA